MIRKSRIENISRILKNLWMTNRISRVQIARNLDLNKSTVTDIVSKLIEQGLIIETEEGNSSPLGGRKPVQLELNKNYGYILGIEITSADYTIVAVDLSGDILYSNTAKHLSSQKSFKEKIMYILTEYPKKLEWIGVPVLGACIGMSGVIDSKSGVIMGSISLKIEEPYNFKELIGTQFDFPVFVENDANSCAWGELAFNRTEKLKNFIFTLVRLNSSENKKIYENPSVGFGIVFDGQVYYGNENSAGEFNSIFCKKDDLGQFKSSFENGKLKKSSHNLKEFTQELAKHLALFTNTFNLGQLFFGGDMEPYKDIVKPIIKGAIKDNWMYASPVNCEIRFSSFTDKSVAYGAAGMALEQLFRRPEKILM